MHRHKYALKLLFPGYYVKIRTSKNVYSTGHFQQIKHYLFKTLTVRVVHHRPVVIGEPVVVVGCRRFFGKIALLPRLHIGRLVGHGRVAIMARLLVVEAECMANLVCNYADLCVFGR
jgi:hypothetical protein